MFTIRFSEEKFEILLDRLKAMFDEEPFAGVVTELISEIHRGFQKALQFV